MQKQWLYFRFAHGSDHSDVYDSMYYRLYHIVKIICILESPALFFNIALPISSLIKLSITMIKLVVLSCWSNILRVSRRALKSRETTKCSDRRPTHSAEEQPVAKKPLAYEWSPSPTRFLTAAGPENNEVAASWPPAAGVARRSGPNNLCQHWRHEPTVTSSPGYASHRPLLLTHCSDKQ